MQIKGWMIDAARLPEPLAAYRRLIDFCAEWGFNTLLFRLADDQGSALRFASHPELATHANAYTPTELADLAAYAAARGIDLIPEVESFGHTGWITRAPDHTALLDDDPASGSHYTGLIPNHPAVLALLDDLYREVAAIFPSPYLHAGCDEVNWGGSEYSRSAIRADGRPAVWTAYLNRLNTLARQNGKTLLVWADHVLHHEPQILSGLDRGIILVDWNYWDGSPAGGPADLPGPIETAARTALAGGFRVIGAPAWGWCRWGARAGAAQLRNIDAFADAYRALSAESGDCLGVIVTNWVPSRFVPCGLWDAPAYAAVALNKGAAAGAADAAWPRFVAGHYGAAWNADWADLFDTLYAITPPRRGCAEDWMAPFQPPVWADESSLAALLAGETPPLAADLPFGRLLRLAQGRTLGVTRNQPDFEAFILALRWLGWIHERCALALSIAGPAPREGVENVLAQIARGDAELLAALEENWNLYRFPADPALTTLLPALAPDDQLLYRFRAAAAFSARLARDPARFFAH